MQNAPPAQARRALSGVGQQFARRDAETVHPGPDLGPFDLQELFAFGLAEPVRGVGMYVVEGAAGRRSLL